MASLVRVWISFGESAMPAVHELGEGSQVIGREASCNIPIDDASVSRNHASIAFENGQYVLRDHGSVNGTFVNGEAIRTHVLQHGDTIRFGEIVFLFQEGEVTPEMAQELLQNQAPEKLEPTASYPIQQVPVPPAQNNPVKVMISNKQKPPAASKGGEHYTSRTIPISTNVSPLNSSREKQGGAAGKTTDYAFISYVCGSAGAIGFLPAIFYGHQATPANPEEEKYQIRGLTLGYLFLALWVFGTMFFTIYGEKLSPKNRGEDVQTVLEAPKVTDGLKLLQGPLMWSPTRKQIQLFTEKVPTDPKEKRVFNQIYGDAVTQWESGLIVYQPDVLKVIPAFSEKDHLKLVIEDFLTKPTFLDYNSTVIPAKKDPIGHFIVPSLSSSMFFARDQNLQASIDRFNSDDFPWHNAYRGIAWMGDSFDYNASQIPLIRVLFILKTSSKTYGFSIKTREGNLNSDYEQTYRLSYYPAEYIAEVIYIDKTETVLALKTNSAVFLNQRDELRAQSLIRANLWKIVQAKLDDEVNVPSSFKLGALFDALQKFPIPSASDAPAPAKK
ncbi:MAG: FHA domain-containing protein [Verrucomicrobiota bacterium]